MKILVIQLARLGDVIQTWPTIRGLRRQYPEAEIHFLIRQKFHAACEGLDAIDCLHILDTRGVVGPLLNSSPDIFEALNRLDWFIGRLKEIGFNRIINLSFSPFSSYLTDAVAEPETELQGYSRTSDDYLAIYGEPSAYFYAQVGPGNFNRIHVTDLFGIVAQTPLKWDDLKPPESARHPLEEGQDYVVVHLGGSQETKRIPLLLVNTVIEGLLEKWDGRIILIGSGEDQSVASSLKHRSTRVENWCGQTSLKDLFSILRSSRLLVGPDSVPIHIATMTNTPTINISSRYVNFWETGPRADIGYVLPPENTKLVIDTCLAVVFNKPVNDVVSFDPIKQTYIVENDDDFCWRCIKALYMAESWPGANNVDFIHALWRIRQANEVALDAIESLSEDSRNTNLAELLNTVDEIVLSVGKMVPSVRPIVRWYECEKVKVPPGRFEEIRLNTLKIHQAIENVAYHYLGENNSILTEEANEG